MYFRLGSSGGIGVPPGTVVLTTEAMNGLIKPEFNIAVLGKSCGELNTQAQY